MVDYMIVSNIAESMKLLLYNKVIFRIFGDYIMEDCRSYANDDDLVCDSYNSNYEEMRYDLD